MNTRPPGLRSVSALLLVSALLCGRVTPAVLPPVLPLAVAAGFAAEAIPLVFTHVTVIDATGRPALPSRTVIVAGNRIQAIGETGRLRTPRGAKVVDATGKFMIPGLWDMHVHFRGGAASIPGNEFWLSLFVANGVTGVREMGGDIAATVFQWRAEIANGARFGPRILTSGPKLDGPSPSWEGSFAVTDAQSARDAVRKLKSMGADFVKIYAPGFPRDTFSALMDEAKQQNPVCGRTSPIGHSHCPRGDRRWCEVHRARRLLRPSRVLPFGAADPRQGQSGGALQAGR
jgi:hypothetical protein